jgi:hypothetical protein
MSTTPETVPTVWSTDDENFFRAVADVFAPGFLWGAGVLLGSYDCEPVHQPLTPAASCPAPGERTVSSPLAA